IDRQAQVVTDRWARNALVDILVENRIPVAYQVRLCRRRDGSQGQGNDPRHGDDRRYRPNLEPATHEDLPNVVQRTIARPRPPRGVRALVFAGSKRIPAPRPSLAVVDGVQCTTGISMGRYW